MTDLEKLVMVLLALGVGFFVLREFFCWYWKQNELVGLLKTVVARLEALEAQGRAPTQGPAARPGATEGGPAAQLPGYTAYTVRPAPGG